jgi:hypothetical protein
MQRLNSQRHEQALAAVTNINRCSGCSADDELLSAFFAPPSYGKFNVQPIVAAELQLLNERFVEPLQ